MHDTFTTTAAEQGKRIDAVCGLRYPSISRSRWRKVGVFKQEGAGMKPSTKVAPGQTWTVECMEHTQTPTTLEPWEYPLQVLDEGESWVVVHKPAGMNVHPSPSDPTQQTLVNALVWRFGTALSHNTDTIEGQDVPRPGLVHRIDKPTEGLLLVAKTDATHTALQAEWSSVEKYYLAWVDGEAPRHGVIESGIMRHPHQRQRMMVNDTHPKRKKALTSFTRLVVEDKRSLLLCRIYTGRTHQIRVHLRSIGFPVYGDTLYNSQAVAEDGKPLPSLQLYATVLVFTDPDTLDTPDKSTRHTVIDPVCLSLAEVELPLVKQGIATLRDMHDTEVHAAYNRMMQP